MSEHEHRWEVDVTNYDTIVCDADDCPMGDFEITVDQVMKEMERLFEIEAETGAAKTFDQWLRLIVDGWDENSK